MRINKFIAANSNYSRRKADELIQAGLVFINNKQNRELGVDIDPEKDTVKINGKIIKTNPKKIYLALNKPKDYITTRSDNLKRKTVMSLVPKTEGLKPVGRLDKDTEGLLLFSNDGEFINKHTHPKFECEKEYFIQIKGELKEREKKELENGVPIDGKKTSKSKIKILQKTQKQTNLTITIHEGRNRQIRKMFAYLKYDVKYLQRTKIGNIPLGFLKKGTYRTLTKSEINAY